MERSISKITTRQDASDCYNAKATKTFAISLLLLLCLLLSGSVVMAKDMMPVAMFFFYCMLALLYYTWIWHNAFLTLCILGELVAPLLLYEMFEHHVVLTFG
ncbi:hypothetical protein GQX74_001356 [Glossina fuscipes]|nr:hypothetical protein GQX74_001356 [Glossina fuscipes]